jgi:hypothetical protein
MNLGTIYSPCQLVRPQINPVLIFDGSDRFGIMLLSEHSWNFLFDSTSFKSTASCYSTAKESRHDETCALIQLPRRVLSGSAGTFSPALHRESRSPSPHPSALSAPVASVCAVYFPSGVITVCHCQGRHNSRLWPETQQILKWCLQRGFSDVRTGTPGSPESWL